VKKFLKILLTISLFSALILSLIIFLVVRGYILWQRDFDKNLVEENIFALESGEEESTRKKVEDFTLSSENTDSLSLTKNEVSNLVLSVSREYLGNGVQVRRVYLVPNKSKWVFYLEFVYRDIPVWFSIDLNKDSMQTAQLYTTDLMIGPYSIGKYFNITDRINTGIANALLTVNENGFSGRYLENIEVMEDSVVVKGSKY